MHRPGYDGTSVSQSTTPFVPQGVAFWELGTSKAESKANDDYDKRVAEHRERIAKGETEDLSKATFVALSAVDWHDPKPKKKATKKAAKKTRAKKAAKSAKTARPLLGKTGWEKAKLQEGVFGQVVALDSSNLEEWLREAPSVAFWLANEMGRPVSGANDVSTYWNRIQAGLTIQLSPATLLASRNGVADRIREWAEGSASDLTVRCHSPHELVAFFCAWCENLPILEKTAIHARSVVVDDRETWKTLVGSPNPMLLIVSPLLRVEAEDVSAAILAGHSVLRQAGVRASSPGSSDPILERIREADLVQSLEAGGVHRIEAQRIARDSGGMFTILRRIRSKHQVTAEPAWAKSEILASLLLAGAWEDERENDLEALVTISGRSYSSLREEANRWSIESDDPPISLIISGRGQNPRYWRFQSSLDAWQFLHRLWSPKLLSRFQTETIAILTDDDPALTLAPEDRPMASLKGKARKYSGHLRKGVAQILAVCASRQNELGEDLGYDYQRLASDVVASVLPAGASWMRWASLSNELRLLMEAAPDEFLTAIESDLDSADPQLAELIRQETSGIYGRAHHSGLLWALEAAAWAPDNFERVAAIITRLSELDPGGTWANRPIESVTGLFFCRRSQSITDVGTRLGVLRTLQQRFPASTWTLLKKLVPRSGRVVMWPSTKPIYRNWAAVIEEDLTKDDLLEFASGVVDLLIEGAEGSDEKWLSLFEIIGSIYFISRPLYQKILGRLQDHLHKGTSTNERKVWWKKLNSFISDQTRFEEGEWQFSPEEIAKWKQTLTELSVKDPIVLLGPLFGEDALDYSDDSLPYEEQRQQLLVQRMAALRNLFDQSGTEGIVEVLKSVEDPFGLGWAMACELGDVCLTEVIPKWLTDEDPKVVKGARNYLAQRVSQNGSEWARQLPTESWTPQQQALLALATPIDQSSWTWVENRGEAVGAEYWAQVYAWGSSDLTEEEATYGCEKLVKSGREWDALHFVMSCDAVTKNKISAPILAALSGILASGSEARGTMDAYRLQESIKLLEGNVDQLGLEEVANWEFAFLSLLDRRSFSPVALERRLSTEPAYFVETLAKLYFPLDDVPEHEMADDEEGEAPFLASGETPEPRPEPSEIQRLTARNVYQLLDNWSLIPGSLSGNQIDEKALSAWVIESRRIATEAKLLRVCDSHIGQLFAKSPLGEDSAIPHEAVRTVLEEIRADRVDRGLEIGIHNLRRSYSKDLYEGGNQERKLAERFRGFADLCKKWPRTRRILQRVSKDYLSQAVKEDGRARGRR
ncbi:hypothetical protein KBB96_04815 [Luteolibacter ambystomatis]|uniref:PLD phosphodiesterase domain-containing protein n=1 Tax=Luteolibacter ambystomatis TaxID=2824561 RepID=A0A975J1D9_9BACT|nr:hypothetical protein [Luteolibacter ambystomatis]QUE52214.1 hypothetical protein KBB96_04815 [Luteolibacter ambystomatis]